MVGSQVPSESQGLAALVEQLHKQNTDHDRHGYNGWKDGCPTCELLGRFAAVVAVSTVASRAEGPVRGPAAIDSGESCDVFQSPLDGSDFCRECHVEQVDHR